jgi:uncharacterized protein YqgC (DUF456 family)
MELFAVIGWLVVIGLFVIGMLGAIFPILPGVFAIFAGFIAYGLFFDFSAFGLWFWLTQICVLVLVIVAEYLISSIAVKRSGGSNASVTGTNVGLILGPFLIPVFGIILGPLLGSIVGEMKSSQDPHHLLKVGFGSLVGFVISVIIKIILQALMIILFFIWLWNAPDLSNTIPI